MKAEEGYLKNFLSRQYHMMIPIYQRKYNWTNDQCKQLFSDILSVGNDDNLESYFIGSIVFKKEESPLFETVENVNLIDGQQRITTITLLFSSLCNYLKNSDKEEYKKFYDNYLVNNDINKSVKLNLTKNDDETLKKIIYSISSDKELVFDEDDSLNIKNNYDFFSKNIDEKNLPIILKGINKLSFISVGLERFDNAQLIFESLNSTGMELNKSDLIRNYLLMGLDNEKQNEIYQNYWFDIESGFINDDKNFDAFIRNYLTVKLNRIPIKSEVYDEFKRFAKQEYSGDVEGLVKDIYKYADYNFRMFYEKEDDLELKKVFNSLNYLDFNVTHPFLLAVYDDYLAAQDINSNIKLSKADFIQIVKYVESYVLRRYICEIPTNSMNNTFANLHKNIDNTDYLKSFIADLLQYDNYKRFPNNMELSEALKTKDIYKNSLVRRHMLEKLENYDNKDIVNVENCTIEHIMPQHLSKEWQKELGENFKEIHDKYLHTLGNLTLTSYNSEMSDKTFEEKKIIQGGFIQSKLTLNHSLCELDKWGENEINNRREELTKNVIDIWEYPEKTHEILELIELKKENKSSIEYSLEDYEYLQEKTHTRSLYDLLSQSILNLDDNVKENILKYYIVFKINNNFVEIVPQKRRLKILLDIPISDLDDPQNICEDITDKGRHGTGVTVTYLKREKDVYYMMKLIKQAYEYVKN